MIIPAAWLAIEKNYIWALVIFVAAMLTDLLDGYIARKYNMISKSGMMLDPLADKLMAVTMVGILCFQNALPMFVFIVVLAKELIMIAGGLLLAKRGVATPANIVGKLSALLFNCAIGLSLLNEYVAPVHEIVMYVALVLTVIALLQYAYLNVIKPFGQKQG